MAERDFYLLFAAFAGFVGAPALMVWGFLRLWPGRSPKTPGPSKGSGRKSLPAAERRSDPESPRYADSEFAAPGLTGRSC